MASEEELKSDYLAVKLLVLVIIFTAGLALGHYLCLASCP